MIQILTNNNESLKSRTVMSYRILSLFLLMLFVSGILYARDTAILSNNGNVLQLNPDYKLKRLSTGTVIVYTNKADGEIIRLEFKDIYAEVLLGALRKQTVEQLVPVVARKFYFAEDECRREIKHAINVFEEWQILLSKKPQIL